MIIGFTGTRNGMTKKQSDKVYELLQGFAKEYGHLALGLHGDCVGADDDFNMHCLSENIRTLCRPCTFENMRAHSTSTQIAEPVPPMQRNRAIVTQADVMLACPPNYTEIKRGSGTWATIKFSRRAKKPLYIVFPDGTMLKENT